MNFCDRLKNAREDRDISQKDMAEKLGISQPNYSRIETGIQEPNLDQLIKIAEIFEISIDELLGVDPEKYIYKRAKSFETIVNDNYNKTFGKQK